jgi:hypothetical protein
MEFTSYLAGERWSDHPACTHPLLSELARQVNDFSSDGARQALLELVPDMIGLSGTDLRIDLRVALRAAQTALPIAAEERQRVMAAAVLTCERLTADLDGRTGAPLSQGSSDALALAPGAARWAYRYTRNLSISHRAFRRRAAPAIVRSAVAGIAHACAPDPDAVLHGLLARAIEDCKAVTVARPASSSTAHVRRNFGVRRVPRGPRRVDVIDQLLEDDQPGPVADDVRVHRELEDAAGSACCVELVAPDLQHVRRSDVGA